MSYWKPNREELKPWVTHISAAPREAVHDVVADGAVEHGLDSAARNDGLDSAITDLLDHVYP
jgi:hypothetical protein